MPTYMRHAVVGYFKDETSAQAAVDDLIENGFSKDAVHISSGTDYATDAATGGSGLTGRAPSENQGGITGWFRSLFESNDYDTDATRYSERTRSGGSVVAVDTTDRNRDQAVRILNSHGASDIDDDATSKNPGQERKIPVAREELQVGKRPVQSGGVRVYSKTVSEPVEEQVRLRQDRVTIDRQPADRPVTGNDEALWRDQTIDVMEISEEPVIEKRARVVEEVRIGKESTERTETVRDNVRHTEVQAEPIGGKTNYTSDFERDFQSRYGATGGEYRTYAPAYEYGSTMAGDPRYKGKDWNAVEPSLRTEYGRRYPQSSWDRMKDAVRYGWDKVTGKL